MANEGKYFESDVIKSIKENNNLSLYRLYDVTGGRAGVRNIADFIAYKYPHEYFLELKSTKDNRLNFNYISDNQYTGLLEKSKIPGIYAGVLINFRGAEKTYFVDINIIKNMKEVGAKSISLEYSAKVGVELEGVKKRVRFIYNVDKLLTDISEEASISWEEKLMKESCAL